jgi:hypothetical protein
MSEELIIKSIEALTRGLAATTGQSTSMLEIVQVLSRKIVELEQRALLLEDRLDILVNMYYTHFEDTDSNNQEEQ